MDIMKNKMLQENIQQERYQSKTTDDLHLEKKMGAGENIELKRPMTIGDKIDQLMPKELKKGTQLQKAPIV